jgi:trk system potassium uptake protein TrkH
VSAKFAADSSRETVPLAALQRGHVGELLWWMLFAYLLLIFFCSFWLHVGKVKAGGQSLTYDRALFLSVSTATLSGFQQTIGPNDFTESIQGPVILIILTLAGSLMAMIVGGLAAVRVLRMPFTDGQIIVGALTLELMAVLAGTAVLYCARADLIDAVLQSACALGNSGQVITGTTSGLYGERNRFPSFSAWQSQCILLPLSVIGGLGLPVVMELYDRLVGGAKRLSMHSRTVIKLTAGIYLVATVVLFIVARVHRAPVTHTSRLAFLAASTTAINARTAGFPFEVLDAFGHPAQWLIVLLMVIGASPAGTGSGLKATTFWHLFRGIRDILRGRPVPRVVGIAAVWFAAYVLLAVGGFLLLSVVASQMNADQAGFLTISALSNVGLSHDPVSITGPGLFVLDLIMLAGRFAPLAVLWWMAGTTRDADVLVA